MTEQDHIDWLFDLATQPHPPITLETAHLSVQAWHAILDSSVGKMPLPAACSGPDGELFYSWDQGRHHLELEIIPGQLAEFFYRDRETEQFWGEDYQIGDSLPPVVASALGWFSRF